LRRRRKARNVIFGEKCYHDPFGPSQTLADFIKKSAILAEIYQTAITPLCIKTMASKMIRLPYV